MTGVVNRLKIGASPRLTPSAHLGCWGKRCVPRNMGVWLRLWGILRSVALLLMALCGEGRAQSAGERATALHTPTWEDLLQLREFDEVAVSPDGHWAAYVTSARFHSDGVRSPERLTLVDVREDTAHTVVVSGHPHGLQWSPDGSTLAFLASSRGASRVCIYTVSDTLARPVVVQDSLAGRLLAFTWSPTGDEIAYVASEPRPSGSERDSAGIPPRLVLFHDAPGDFTGPTVPTYGRDSLGAYVAVAPVGGGLATVLARHVVSAKYSPTIDWSGTGMLLVSGAPIGVSWWLQITARALYMLNRRTRAIQHVRSPGMARRRPTWSPSGQRVAYIGYAAYPQGSRLSQIFSVGVEDARQPNTARRLSRESDGLSLQFPPIWADSHTIYIARYELGTARLFSIDVASKQWRAITPDTLSVSRYTVSRNGKTVLAVLESANQAQELYRIDPVTDALHRLTYGAGAVPPVRLGHVEQVTWPSQDGRFTIHGFLVKPPAYDSTHRYPLIVLVHGGPGALFTNSFVPLNFWQQGYIPPQWLASAGYLVLLPNPRGDGSYGETFAAALHADWGPGPFSDVNAGVSALIARGLVDSTAIGIAGVSYGGYLTAYAITRTYRFAAASIDDGPTDLRSEYGINYAFHAAFLTSYFGGTPWTRPEIYAVQSPITYVDHVRAPVLMRYGGRGSTDDNIRPSYMLAQGLEFYAGLRDAGVPVEFVLHPDQGHAAVDWALYKDWVMRNLRWFNYWLCGEGTNPVASPQ